MSHEKLHLNVSVKPGALPPAFNDNTQGRLRMKIAEALALRADLQSELEKSARELTLLIQRVNRTNAASRFGAGTLADPLA